MTSSQVRSPCRHSIHSIAKHPRPRLHPLSHSLSITLTHILKSCILHAFKINKYCSFNACVSHTHTHTVIHTLQFLFVSTSSSSYTGQSATSRLELFVYWQLTVKTSSILIILPFHFLGNFLGFFFFLVYFRALF